MSYEIREGDVLNCLREMPDESIQCCVTSPPYWGLRDYGVEGQIGLEKTPQEYVEKMVEVFREVRRVLRDDGTFWLNVGDSYSAQGGQANSQLMNKRKDTHREAIGAGGGRRPPPGLKPKDLVLIPYRLILALQDDGWWVRSQIAWTKKSSMPESIRDRPTSAWEPIFLLTKAQRYFYDAEAVRVPTMGKPHAPGNKKLDSSRNDHDQMQKVWGEGGANLRNVWHLGPEPFPDAHFATFPTEIPRRAIKAGSKTGDTILDPFMGSGTTLLVAEELGRESIGIELNHEYAEMAEKRIQASLSVTQRKLSNETEFSLEFC